MNKNPHPAPNIEAGQKLAGCYLLESSLEAGSRYPIWIAQDEVLGKQVSLHLLPPSIARDADAIEALRHEIKRNRPLIHPRVLRVYDLVEGADWTAVAMESFQGRALGALLEEQGRFEVGDIQQWLDDICVALEEAHRIKLTHLDLTSENIFINSSGHAVLANFGIGRIVQSSLQKTQPTELTAAHWSALSPQVLDGESPSPSDDVYGLGALLFQLLTGHPVFDGGDFPSKIRTALPPKVSEVRDDASDPGEFIPEGWDNVIAACLHKRSDERPQHPADIVSSIEAYNPATGSANDPRVSAEEEAETVSEPIPVETLLPAAVTVKAQEETPAPAELALPAVVEEPAPEPVLSEPKEPHIAHDAPVATAEVVEAAEAPVEPETVIARETATAPTAEDSREQSREATHVAPPETAESAAAESPREEGQSESVAQPPAPGAKPVHLYDTEEDAFSSILPRRYRFPAAVAAAVALVLFLINGAFKGPKDKSGTAARPIATGGIAEHSELTSVKNSLSERPASQHSTPANAVSKAAPAAQPAASASQGNSKPEETLLAAGPSAKKAVTPIAVAPSAAATPAPATGAGTDKTLPEKLAGLERLKADLANAEKAQQTRTKEQEAAAAALAAAQKAIDDKAKAVEAAKKDAAELLAARTKIEDEQKSAETAAQAAQQLAAEKARASEAAKKALADFEAKNRDKLAGHEKAQTEMQALQRGFAEKQKAAEDIAKAAAAAESARQQQLAAVKQKEQEIEQLQATAKASAEDAQRKQAMETERRKLDDEIAAMRVLFEQKMKDIESRKRELESGAAAPGHSASPAQPPVADTKAPTAAVPVATPAPTLPLMARAATPAPAPVAAPQIATPAPLAGVAGGAGNSLGMRFAAVGDVQFCVWQTRVKDFEAFAKAVNLKSTAWRGPGFRQGPDHPVVNVTWTEAIAFCKWLTDKERKEGTLATNQFYRLPYDLEWSKAVGLPDESGRTPEARDMGVPDVYPWGTDWPPPKGAGNYTGEETGSDVAIKGYDDGFAWTSPVGSFPPNKLGLYDMGGNVWQWCMDAWNNESKAKVLRGASWYNGALKLSLLSSCRVHAAPDSSTDNYGFRIVRATETLSAKPAKK